VDCLVCHDRTGTYEKAPAGCGDEKKGLDLVKIARGVGRPTRANCGSCHFCGGGGDAIKHGNLSEALIDPPRELDVHMGGLDFACQDCHTTNGHRIAGASMTTCVSEGRVSCTDCHDERPHATDRHAVQKTLNDHCDAIACETCHIPQFAKAKPTLLFWNWALAGRDTKELENSPYCITTQHRKKGLFIKKANVAPAYAWYNGRHERYRMGERVDVTGTTYLNPPAGGIQDPKAKISPFKIHTGVQPADAAFQYLLIPKLWGGYWEHFDWERAIRSGMKEAELSYSGKSIFVTTVMHWRLNHGVVPKEQALGCMDCHGAKALMDFEALGYPEDPAAAGGRFGPGSDSPKERKGP